VMRSAGCILLLGCLVVFSGTADVKSNLLRAVPVARAGFVEDGRIEHITICHDSIPDANFCPSVDGAPLAFPLDQETGVQHWTSYPMVRSKAATGAAFARTRTKLCPSRKELP
jgi:hypothetical protein